MDNERKRQLKKAGKQLVAENSARVKQRLQEENPFHYTDPEWVQNYKEVHKKNKAFRVNTDHVISVKDLGDLARLKILDFKYDGLLVPKKGVYLHCHTCEQLVPTFATVPLCCACKAIDLDLENKKAILPPAALYSTVKIEALGSIRGTKPWWKFW